MELGLFQKQTMNLVMTTELRQSIALLQYSALELSHFIQEHATENPLIELEEQTLGLDNYYGESSSASRTVNTQDNNFNPLSTIASKNSNRCEDLLEQVNYLSITKQEQKIMKYIILNLDDHGYIPMQDRKIAEDLCISTEKVAKVIDKLQQLEPIGVGARNLKECLTIQAKHYYPDKPLLTCVIAEYLDLLADKKWQELGKLLNISKKELSELANLITSLHPRPYSASVDSETQILYPDVSIEKVNGEYSITFYDPFMPKVRLNEAYLHLKQTQSNAGAFIRENYHKYKWLIKSIEQRKTTIINITKAIVERQQPFLEKGFTHLKPMTLKEIADQIGMHESTISRATSNKVIRTPIGCFEMRKLFTGKIAGDNGTEVSATQIKLRLKQLIQQENRKRPLSDQKLADHFKKNGITISRRTIAKYREELNILSSSKRKTIG